MGACWKKISSKCKGISKITKEIRDVVECVDKVLETSVQEVKTVSKTKTPDLDVSISNS
jgi:hypothetical protein